MPILILLMTCLFTLSSVAEEYNPYVSLSLGYILNQPDYIRMDCSSKDQSLKMTIHLYQGDNLNYKLETGIKVPVGKDDFILGISYMDILNQGRSRMINRPVQVTPFIQYQWNYDRVYTFLGAGYKVYSDEKIRYETIPEGYYVYNKSPVLDKITARLGIGYTINNSLSLSLEHHSQWFKGKPFNNSWEYHSTSLMINFLY